MFDKVYIFYGKHADMIKKLTTKLSDDIGRGFFFTNYEVYQVAPLVGFIYKRTSLAERSDNITKIFPETMIGKQQELIFNYRNLMALIYKDKPREEMMEIAFHLDHDDEKRKQYDELYDSYVLGGLEEIYERIFEKNDADTIEEYLMNLHEFLQDLNARLYGVMEVEVTVHTQA